MKLINYIIVAAASLALAACTSSDILDSDLKDTTAVTKSDDLETLEVKLDVAGTLAEKLGDKKSTVQKMILSGLVDADDVNTFRDMVKLTVLDMKGVEFVESEKTYDSYSLDITGPRPAKHKIVKGEISPWMFYDAKFKPKSVILPNNIVAIGEYAFRGTPLEIISIPKGVKKIAVRAFENSKVQSIDIPETVKEIEVGAFKDCRELKSIVIPDGVTVIKGSTFSECRSLSEVSIPESVTVISSGAFYRCESLKKITLPEHLTYIGAGCFAFSGLVAIKIPDNVTKIEGWGPLSGESAFYYCTSLISVTLSQGLKMLGQGTFGGCSALTSIEIPSSITVIEKDAFFGCKSLLDVTFSEGLVTISESAFRDCSIKDIVLPESLTSIGREAFAYNKATNIHLPSRLASIGRLAFYKSRNLRSITIPSDVSQVGSGVFAGSYNLNSIFWNTTAPIPDIYYDDATAEGGGNLNCLLYLADGNTPLNSKRLKNIVIDGVADQIILSSETGDFNCPQKFKALKISYTKDFSYPTYPKEAAGWRSISLPFAPTQIKQKDGKVLAPFNSDIEGAKYFWLRKLTAKGFENATSVEAGIPYIIAMPNNERYAAEYNIAGEVTFSAEDATNGIIIPVTTSLLKEEGPSFVFCSSYERIPKNAATYVLNEDNENRKAGSVFVRSERDARSFEAYVTTKDLSTKAPDMFSIDRDVKTRSTHTVSSKPSIDDM